MPDRSPAVASVPSLAQERLWLAEQLTGDRARLYLLSGAYEITGTLDVARLTTALHACVRRHESLRSCFVIDADRPLLVTVDDVEPPLAVEDAATDAAVQAAVVEEALTPFDLGRAPLFRVRLLRLAADRHVLVITLHHLIADAWSLEILVRDLVAAYHRGGETDDTALPLQYADYAQWQSERLRSGGFDADLDYWSNQLAGMSTVDLPTDRARPAVESHTGASHRLALDDTVLTGLHRVARDENATLFMVLLAGFTLMLAERAGQDDIAVGTAVAGRDRPEVHGIIGFFVNLLVLRTRLTPGMTHREVVAAVARTCREAYEHQEAPFEQLVKRLLGARDLSRQPLCQVVFQLIDDPAAELALDGLTVRPRPFTEPTAMFDLMCTVTRHGDRAVAELQYATDLWDAATVEDMADHWTRVLARIATAADTPAHITRGPERTPLPEPERRRYAEPRDPVETALLAIWRDLLERPDLGIHDNFFTSGGHSLLAARIVGLVRTELGADLGIRALFEAPTVAEFASALTRDEAALPVLGRVARSSVVPLSFAQRRLWFVNRLMGVDSSYNVPVVLGLSGGVDVDALCAAVGDVVGRHEVLRTVFVEVDGEPMQQILPTGATDLRVVDVSEAELSDRVTEAANQPFDLSDGTPPCRAHLFRVSPTEHTLVLVLHHIVADGWSLGPLTTDLATAYAARGAGRAPQWTALPVQYADYTLWHHELLGTPDEPTATRTRQLDYWAEQLAGLPEHITLPTRRSNTQPPSGAHPGASLLHDISPELHRRLVQLAQDNGASTFMVLHAALATLLTTLGAGPDIPIATPIAGRQDPQLDNLIGFFVNTLILRTTTDNNPTLTELLHHVKNTDLTAYTNQDLPFEHLVAHHNPTRTLDTPLFQVMLTAGELVPVDRTAGGVRFTERSVPAGTAKFDLFLSVREEFDESGACAGLEVDIEYRTDLFDAEDIEQFAQRYTTVLTAFVAQPDLHVDDLDVRLPDERRRTGAGLARRFPSLLARLRAAMATHPDVTAVEDAAGRLTYRELDRRANTLAHKLVRHGVVPDDRVVVAVPRSTHLVVALLAVLRTGAAYVPLDPTHPRRRNQHVLATAAPAIALVTTDAPPLPLPVAALAVDEPLTVTPGAAPAPLGVTVTPGHAAYVIHTSGSTGEPKGVTLTHATLANLIDWQEDKLGGGPGDRVAQFTTPSFDVAAQEIFGALVSGKTIVVPGDDERRDPEAFTRWLSETGVTELFCPNLMLDAVCRAAARLGTTLPALRAVVQAGEALVLSPRVRDFVAAVPGRRLHNHYGPSETHTTVATTLPADVTAWPSVAPIGRPIANVRTAVLDDALRPVPTLVRGELYLAGPSVARGYLGRPGATAERFLPDPYGPPGSRMYRTGDLSRWNPDGALEFLGRADRQVKIRGFRIEPGEIEAVVRADPRVRSCAVRAVEHAGDTRLVAYVVPRAGVEIEARDIREVAHDALPDYMVPNHVVLLDELPTLPNGKLDAAALPGIAASGGGEVSAPPGTPTEKLLAAVWSDVLGHEVIGVADDFFALGGHSLLATTMVAKLRERHDVELPLRELFRHPTIAELARHLDQVAPTPDDELLADLLDELSPKDEP